MIFPKRCSRICDVRRGEGVKLVRGLEMENPQPKPAAREGVQEPPTTRSRGGAAHAEFSPDGATPPRAPSPARGGGRNFVAAGIVAILLAIGGGVAVTEFWVPAGPHTGITTPTGLGQPYAGVAFLASDALVTDKQWQERAAAFDAFKAKGPAQLDRAEVAQINAFLTQTVTDVQQRQALLGQVQARQVDMVALGLYDDCAEDGDVVNVRAGPINVFVPLKHQIQYVLVPVPRGGSAAVAIAGQSDGQGGGITVGMVTPGGVEHLPRLAPGQQINFSVR
jgi:hypothetical protein